MSSNSNNSPRLGVGFSEERRLELQQANKLKQELYAQQKKIQFSNLLERSNQDVASYIESQANLFIASSRSKAPSENNVATHSIASPASGTDATYTKTETHSEADDRDGVDYFHRNAFKSNKYKPVSYLDQSEDNFFDPESRPHETLYDHLLSQLRLENRYTSLSQEVRNLCEKIIARLDSRGFFTPASAPKEIMKGIVAYPDYDENTEKEIDRFDALFGINSTHELRLRMKQALDEIFSIDGASKASRRWAREEFDKTIGRNTTKEERIFAKKFLDKLITNQEISDPIDLLFSKKPTEQERTLAEKALSIVQSLDPPGVGARNFQESLLLRIKPNPYERELQKLIADHFDDFCKKRIGALVEKSGFSTETITKIFELPFPFYQSPEELFSTNSLSSHYIQPEIVVEETAKGRWTARLDESQQEIRLTDDYVKMLAGKRIDKTTKEYLRRQYFEAQALIDALSNRNSTLLRVAKAIVDFQQAFFDDPNATSQPLTQQQIADKLGLDSSTVSRACNDKWMATPRGLVSFKTFFPKAVTGNVTSADVAGIIKQIIEQENKSSPLSDEKITAILKDKYKVDVSRKTVQEHRDRLNIPNSRTRKRK